MAPIWSKQPFTAVYLLFQIMVMMGITLPWILVRNIPKSARAVPDMSYKLGVINGLVKKVLSVCTTIRANMMGSVKADHNKFKDRYDEATPADTSLYTGVLTPGPTNPAPVGGLWYPARPPAASSDIETEKIVLHFPGGGFVLGFGANMFGRVVADAELRHLKADRVFYAQYRPAQDDSTRFPASLQDVVTCYNYVLSLGFKPQNIIVAGDSCAGNLVLGLLRYFETSTLPKPSGAIVWSPWVHVVAGAGTLYSQHKNAVSDNLPSELLNWGVDDYYPKHDPTAEELAYISPLHHPFKTSVPLVIHGGEIEGLYDSIAEFAQEMKAVEGNQVLISSTRLSTHNLIQSYGGNGLEPEVERLHTDALKLFQQ
ncbi:Alpha/Beta hydrolase protein [Xylariaceae sp. FL1019]|nr:Alpha/Beta hydrolase protein [Xylariaceae sp. FL1019]